MNTASLNNLWTYLQGLALTTNNKKWLADHLYEEMKAEQRSENRQKTAWPQLSEDDLVVSPETMALVEDMQPMPKDTDTDALKREYLIRKHGLHEGFH